jgi:predicted NBD/HSP70 family sugar kinase
MTQNEYTLIGIDGGATKVSGWIINYLPKINLYNLSAHHCELPYASIEGHIKNFTPVDINTQISQRANENVCVSIEESIQGKTYIESTARVIRELFDLGGKKPVLIGIGMPGLKNSDQRGIDAIANGPRMPTYCSNLEETLQSINVKLLAPISRLGSDADYCGVGEFYAADGSFRDVRNAYYLGGGTGAADALLLKNRLIPFDQIKSWMAKTWEMKNELDLSLERYASASGLQYIYSRHSGISVASLNESQTYPPQIAQLAKDGDQTAIKTYQEAATYLSMLIFDRISTLNCGSMGILKFINPNRERLQTDHLYTNEHFDRIIIGQRLGDLMASQSGQMVLTQPFLDNLSALILHSDSLTDETKNHYLQNNDFDQEKLVFSQLREAPALGAGIDAHLCHIKKE